MLREREKEGTESSDDRDMVMNIKYASHVLYLVDSRGQKSESSIWRLYSTIYSMADISYGCFCPMSARPNDRAAANSIEAILCRRYGRAVKKKQRGVTAQSNTTHLRLRLSQPHRSSHMYMHDKTITCDRKREKSRRCLAAPTDRILNGQGTKEMYAISARSRADHSMRTTLKRP
jgi:hypothetical protein